MNPSASPVMSHSLSTALAVAGVAVTATLASRLFFPPVACADAAPPAAPENYPEGEGSSKPAGDHATPSVNPSDASTSALPIGGQLTWLNSAASSAKDGASRLAEAVFGTRGGAAGGGAASGEGASASSILLRAGAAAAAAAVLAGGAALFVRRLRMAKRRRRAVGIIPARFASSRFMGKPLAIIAGKPMIQRTWEQAKLATSLERVVVATDDERISRCCRGFGAEVMMTSAACRNGSERCAEALEKLPGTFDIVVNIQGDEPLVDPETIDALVTALHDDPSAHVATAVSDMKASMAADPNRVKCVVDRKGHALYFSRAMIPHNREGTPHHGFPYMLHLGLQAFDSSFLRRYSDLIEGRLEEEEQLEQLRILEHGYKIKVVKVEHTAHGVDVPGDVKHIEKILLKGGR